MSIDTLLSRLDKVKQTGPGKFIACCPAHDDKSPSLSVAEGDAGRTLVHCFAGCESEDVLAAVGLKFEDLYPEKIGDHSFKRKRQPFDVRQVLAAASHEIMVVCLIAARLATEANEQDQARLILAAGRLNNALEKSQSLGTSPELKKIRRGER